MVYVSILCWLGSLCLGFYICLVCKVFDCGGDYGNYEEGEVSCLRCLLEVYVMVFLYGC